MNRSAPLQRTNPLRRRKAMKRGPSRRSLNRTLAAALYVRWLHTQACVLAAPDWANDCAGPVQQAHARNLNGPTGLGLKEDDLSSIPLCRHHHEQFDQYRGVFAGWTRDQRRAWMVAQIAAAHCAFQLEGGVVP